MTNLAACSHCGSPVVVGDAVCGSCGSRLSWTASASMVATSSRPWVEGDTPPPGSKRRLLWVLLVLVFGAAAAIVVVLLLRESPSASEGPIEAPGGIVMSQVCVNEVYGITVYHPEDWAVYEQAEVDEDLCRYYRPGGFAEFSLVEVWASPLEVSVLEDLGPFEDVVEFYRRGGFGAAPTLEQQIVVGGHRGSLFDLELDLGSGTVHLLHVYVIPLVDGDTTSLPVIIEAQGELGTPEYEEAVLMADAVAATLEFR